MIGLRELWGGYVRVGVMGQRPERLCNLLWNHRVSIWGLSQDPQGEVQFWIAVSDFKVLRRLVRKAGSSIRILEKRGGRFPRQRLLRQKTPLLALLVFLTLVYAVTGFVWVVEVEGEHSLNQVVLEEAISQLGVWPGAWKGRVDLDRVERGLLIRFPQLAWVGARLEGTRVVIQVVEKVQVDPAQLAPGNLVSERAALVKRVMVVSGQARVAPGDTVRPGQVLVEAGEDGLAMGVVEARVWYEAYAEAETVRIQKIYTGEWHDTWVLRVGSNYYQMEGDKGPAYGEYETDRHSWQIAPGRKSSPVIELIKLRHYQVYSREEEVGSQRAKELALLKARETALADIPPEARILDLRSQVVHQTGRVVGVRVLVECLQEIGEYQARDPQQEG